MTDHLAPPIADEQLLDRRIDGELLHLRGLVLVRRLLSDRGATQPELDSHSAQIHRLRNELADVFRDSPGRVAASNDGVADELPPRPAARGSVGSAREAAPARTGATTSGTRIGAAVPASRPRARTEGLEAAGGIASSAGG
jgi:hypothetical protein